MSTSIREMELDLLNVRHHLGVTDFRHYPENYHTSLIRREVALVEEIDRAKEELAALPASLL